jgi:Cu(I)/Ag(I) efflux system membrane fusion protein
MKPINKISFCLLLCLFFITGMTSGISAQSDSVKVAKSSSAECAQSVVGDQTLTLVVPGICEMCKERIESTAMDVKGVKKAEWDIKTNTLVLLGSSKMDKQKVADALAKAGYRSELATADPKGYQKLPACCQYDSGAKKH